MTEASTTDKSDQHYCLLESDTGDCYDYSVKWYFSKDNAGCDRFWYGGCGGNHNRFETEQECIDACKEPPQQTQEVQEVCQQPKNEGPCQAFQSRWYYDEQEGRCLEFQYGGCQGNTNNFKSKKECDEFCGGSTDGEVDGGEEGGDVCKLAKDEGPCYADYLRFYFDEETSECRPFLYGGCQGNGNNFETVKECYGTCGADLQQHRLYTPGNCQEEQKPGPCKAARQRWYFDITDVTCKPFYYGGCQGNGNNFWAHEDCNALCSKLSLTCGVFSCDIECKHGFGVRPDGCLDCRCADPCEKYGCGPGLRCVVVGEECDPDEEACIGPRPVCEPMQITFKETSTDVYTYEGDEVHLHCKANGHPHPTVRWFYDDRLVPADSEQFMQHNGALVIKDVQMDNEGVYTCEASNGMGEPITRDFLVSVTGPFSVTMAAHNGTYSVGADIRLKCEVRGDTDDVNVTWTKDDKAVKEDRRHRMTEYGELFIDDLIQADEGDYSCHARRGEEKKSLATTIIIDGADMPADCVDMPWLANCELIVQAKMCRHEYFRVFCCKTCYAMGLLP